MPICGYTFVCCEEIHSYTLFMDTLLYICKSIWPDRNIVHQSSSLPLSMPNEKGLFLPCPVPVGLYKAIQCWTPDGVNPQ
jgi:hypothetical protein